MFFFIVFFCVFFFSRVYSFRMLRSRTPSSLKCSYLLLSLYERGVSFSGLFRRLGGSLDNASCLESAERVSDESGSYSSWLVYCFINRFPRTWKSLELNCGNPDECVAAVLMARDYRDKAEISSY